MTSEPEATNDCPKCGADWGTGNTSFCGECGYSERLGLDGNASPRDEYDLPSQTGIAVFFAGVLIIPVAMVIARCCQWESESHLTWLIWLASIGGVMALAGHIAAWCVCVSRSDMDLTDIVFGPIRIWTMIFRSLPKGIVAMSLFGFGTMIAVSAGVCFGIDYETIVRQRPYDTREQLLGMIDAVQGLVPSLDGMTGTAAITDDEGDVSNLLLEEEDAVGTSLSTSPVSFEASAPVETARLSTTCLVIGFTENSKGELESLVLAVPEKEKIRFAGTISVGAVAPEAYVQLVERSLPLRRDQPIIECRLEATWLKPDAVCRVEFEGWSTSREFVAPQILEISQHLLAGNGTP